MAGGVGGGWDREPSQNFGVGAPGGSDDGDDEMQMTRMMTEVEIRITRVVPIKEDEMRDPQIMM